MTDKPTVVGLMEMVREYGRLKSMRAIAQDETNRATLHEMIVTVDDAIKAYATRLAGDAPQAPKRWSIEDMANSFYCHIAHGDEKHRDWLKRETVAWFTSRSNLLTAAAPQAAADAPPRDWYTALTDAGKATAAYASSTPPEAPPVTTGWPPSELMQDDCKKLSRALASKPDARIHAREAAAKIEALHIAGAAGVLGDPDVMASPEVCEWEPGIDCWYTSCGKEHFGSIDQNKNNARFCCYCGKGLKT